MSSTASILSMRNWGNSSNEACCSRESMAPMSSRTFFGVPWRSMPSTFAPFSAAEIMAGIPPVPMPTTSTSVSTVSVMSLSSTTGGAPSHDGPPNSPTRGSAGVSAA